LLYTGNKFAAQCKQTSRRAYLQIAYFIIC
jgi:hypothetical protein